MSVIKQISVFDGSNWNINDIGANAGNITLNSSIAGSDVLQTALNNILPASQLTASRAIVTDGNKKLSASAVSATQLGYLSGVTSSIQTQLNAKASALDPTIKWGLGSGVAGSGTPRVQLRVASTDKYLAMVYVPTSGDQTFFKIMDKDLNWLPTKAPVNHSSTTTGYGVGTTEAYGHVKVLNTLPDSYSPGEACSAYKAYYIQNKRVLLSKYIGMNTNSTYSFKGTIGFLTCGINSSTSASQMYVFDTLGGNFRFRPIVSGGTAWLTATRNSSGNITLTNVGPAYAAVCIMYLEE